MNYLTIILNMYNKILLLKPLLQYVETSNVKLINAKTM